MARMYDPKGAEKRKRLTAQKLREIADQIDKLPDESATHISIYISRHAVCSAHSLQPIPGTGTITLEITFPMWAYAFTETDSELSGQDKQA